MFELITSGPPGGTVGPQHRRVISDAELVEHEGLVRWVVCQQWLGGLPFADALHEGRLGLWRALQSYDRSRGTRFSTYAVSAIERAVWRAVREYQQPAPVAPEHALRLELPTVELADLSESLHNAQVRVELHRLVGRLSSRLRQIIVAHYGLDGRLPQTFAAIGSTLGATRQRVQQLHVVALLWLAQPTHSLALRRLLERNRRLHYQQYLARQRKLACARHVQRRLAR